MKLFTKKTLAILLSALIVMGTVSILSFAETTGTVTPETVFYKADGTSTADVIYAKKGDIVKATVKLTTDFPAGQMAFFFQYNGNMFTFATEKYNSLGNGKYTLITEDSATGGYIYQVASEAGGEGYNPTSIALAAGKSGVYITTNKYTVKKYAGDPEFTIYLKVKNSADLAYTEEGTMETLQSFCATNVYSTRPNNVVLYDDDSVIGKTQATLDDDDEDHAWSSAQYTLNIAPDGVSASNKVVLKGSAFFDPNGGTIEGLSDAVEKNGFYGDNIAASDIPSNVVAPSGYTFKGWSTDGSTVLDEAGITAKQFGGTGADIEPTTFKAVYKANAYTITYDPNGGQLTDSTASPKTATYGDALPAEPEVTRDRYNPAGWDWYDSSNTIISTGKPTTMPAENLTAKAKWDGPFNNVTYYKADGTTVYQGPTAVKAGESIGTVPANDGDSHFSRWVDMSDSTKSPADYTAMPSDSDLNFKAVYKYTVTWNYNNNGETANTTDVGEEGTAYTTPSPSWGAHQFNGWVADDGSGAPTGAIPGKDITYTAQWDDFKLTVDLDGGTLATAPDNWVLEDGKYVAEYEDSATVNAPADPTKEGYTFAGWDPTWDASNPVVMDNNKTEKALWNINSYKITYEPGEGAALPATATNPVEGVEYNSALPADPTPTKTGSAFSGWEWYDKDGGKLDSKPATMPAGDLTAKAIWDGIEYTVTFLDQDGTTELGKVSGKYGETVTPIADPTAPAGYEFDKWDPAVPATFTEDTSVKAVYKAKQYNLTVDLDGGAFADDSVNPAGLYDYNTSVAKPAADPVKEGYEFKGWSPEFPVVMTSDKTVKALWSGKTTITLNPGEGKKPDGTPYEPIVMDSDSKDYPDIPDPVLDGKEFDGWYWKDKDGEAHRYDFTKTPEENIGAGVSGDIPLTANFLTKHTVTYIVDGATVKTESLLTGADITAGVPADPTKEGFVFGGWKDAAGKTPYDYKTMPDNDVTFTAVFNPKEADKYTYKFVDRGNTITSGQLAEGDPIPTPEEPNRFGYKFAGWKPDVPTYMPAGDMTFEAQWEVDKTFVALIIGGTAVAGGVAAGVAAANTALIAGGAVVGGIVAIAIAANTHKVTYLVDGNTYRVFYILKGTKVIVPKDPTKDGCTFNGWDPEVPDVMPDHDLTFNAKFSGSAAGNTGSEVISDVPATGSATAGLAVFAVISSACAAAYVIGKRKHS